MKLVDLIPIRESSDKHKYMKAAFEIANSYARRGYDPKEAVEDAATTIKLKTGYELSEEDKAALRAVVYVHPNFR